MIKKRVKTRDVHKQTGQGQGSATEIAQNLGEEIAETLLGRWEQNALVPLAQATAMGIGAGLITYFIIELMEYQYIMFGGSRANADIALKVGGLVAGLFIVVKFLWQDVSLFDVGYRFGHQRGASKADTELDRLRVDIDKLERNLARAQGRGTQPHEEEDENENDPTVPTYMDKLIIRMARDLTSRLYRGQPVGENEIYKAYGKTTGKTKAYQPARVIMERAKVVTADGYVTMENEVEASQALETEIQKGLNIISKGGRPGW